MAQLADPNSKSTDPAFTDGAAKGSQELDVQGSDVQGSDVQGSDVQGSDAQDSDSQDIKSSRLGYELLYANRRPGRLTLPLLPLPKTESVRRTTGSLLLDSFVRDRTQESPALRTLRLISVATSLATPTAKPADTAPQQHPPLPPHEAIRLTPATALLTQKKDAEKETAKEASKAADPKDKAKTSIHSDLWEDAPTSPAAKASPATDTAAAADDIPVSAASNKAVPNRAVPNKKNRHRKPYPKSPQPQASTQAIPIRSAPILPSSGVNAGKLARDSAAAVGLLDINDTLLFGGDHEDLSCVDPFITQVEAPSSGVFTYLKQQVSAFKVSKLVSNSPINTNLSVLNRPDSPIRETILGNGDFQLGTLTEEPEEAPPISAQPAAEPDTVQVADLSRQVQALNQKIEYLSKKLEEATG
ncbi:MAG: hypothetical protein AAFR58_04570 [Cyanobacteria bacterium J06627_28]